MAGPATSPARARATSPAPAETSGVGSELRGLFVTGTDTGAGKTVVAGAIVAALRLGGRHVRPFKPVLTGLAEPAEANWPADHALLAAAAGLAPEEVSLQTYDPPVSPHLAAELSGRPVDGEGLVHAIRRMTPQGATVVVEGVGGLLVPLGEGWDVRRLAAGLDLPLVIAARPGLGTINHTLLTLEVAARAGLRVAGVVLTPWPEHPGTLERSNRATIERLGQVPVATLAPIARGAPELLAAAGASLPLAAWLRDGGQG